MEAIFKIGSMNLFNREPSFCYRELLKFRGLRIGTPKDCR